MQADLPIDIQTFCDLQGCSPFNTSAITKFCKNDDKMNYEGWYNKLSGQFSIGSKKDIPTEKRVRQFVEEVTEAVDDAKTEETTTIKKKKS